MQGPADHSSSGQTVLYEPCLIPFGWFKINFIKECDECKHLRIIQAAVRPDYTNVPN